MQSIIAFLKKIIKPLIPFWLGVKIRGWWQIVMSWYYLGSKQYCPYCNNRFRKFLPGGEKHDVVEKLGIIGAGYRTNMLCPRCYSTDRDRLVFLYLEANKDLLASGSRILHLAPEGCLKSLISKLPGIRYSTGDKYAEGYTDYYYDREIPEVDLTALPFPDNSFDLFICNHVLEHIRDDKKAMSEIFRTMKPGATAILQVPVGSKLTKTFEDNSINTDAEREKHYGQFDHVRVYGRDYSQRLENAGFIVKPIEPSSLCDDEKIKKLSVNPKEILYIAIKP